MQWIYSVDLFFWNLQKISTLIIVGWLLRLWWRRSRGQVTAFTARLKEKVLLKRLMAKLRTYHSRVRGQAALVFGRRKNLTNK